MVSRVRSREHPAGMGALLSLRHRAARARSHADGDEVVRRSPKGHHAVADRRSVFQIRADAGRPVRLERRLHQQSGDAGCLGRAHSHRGPRVRRRRRAGAGLHAGDLAGRCAGPLRRSAGQARAAEFDVPGLRPLRHRCERRLCASTPSSRARCPIPTASRRRRISCSRSSRAACCCISTRGSISTARPPTRPIRCWRWCRPIAAAR